MMAIPLADLSSGFHNAQDLQEIDVQNLQKIGASLCVQVGYCQGMNYLAAMLLLALERSEENSFWLLVALIDDGGKPSLAAVLHQSCDTSAAWVKLLVLPRRD